MQQLTVLIKPPQVNVLGVGIHALNLHTAVDLIDGYIAMQTKGYVCVTGVHGVMEASRSTQFLATLDQALLVVPDGMPMVWIGKWQKHTSMGRVFGPDFMRNLCARSVATGYTHFLYGGKPGVADELRRNLIQWYPGIQIVGTFTPPFRSLTPEEKSEFESTIRKVRPDIIWVGLSTPKQECFMSEMIDRLECKIMVGVGAAFDIHTGRIKDAPSWMKTAGLQWLHRLYQEPRRLWKRYVINNSRFIFHLALQLSGIKQFELTSERQKRFVAGDTSNTIRSPY